MQVLIKILFYTEQCIFVCVLTLVESLKSIFSVEYFFSPSINRGSSQANWASLDKKEFHCSPLVYVIACEVQYTLAVKRIWLALLSHALYYAPDDPNWEDM
jgi:hypothetical protein